MTTDEDIQTTIADRITNEALILGIDIGGTKLAAGVVGADGRALSLCVQPTPRDADAEGLLAAVVSLAKRASD